MTTVPEVTRPTARNRNNKALFIKIGGLRRLEALGQIPAGRTFAGGSVSRFLHDVARTAADGRAAPAHGPSRRFWLSLVKWAPPATRPGGRAARSLMRRQERAVIARSHIRLFRKWLHRPRARFVQLACTRAAPRPQGTGGAGWRGEGGPLGHSAAAHRVAPAVRQNRRPLKKIATTDNTSVVCHIGQLAFAVRQAIVGHT